MGFFDTVKTFIDASRLGKLLQVVFMLVRSKIDSNGDGNVDAVEVLEAIPVKYLAPFDNGVVSRSLPALIVIIKDIQASVK
jgi:hypothetical protein